MDIKSWKQDKRRFLKFKVLYGNFISLKNVLLPSGLTCRHLIQVFMPRIHLKRNIKVIKRANLSRRLKKKLEKYFMFRIIPLNLQNSIVFYQLFLVPCSCQHWADPNYFPLVEQIVASRGRIFIGTFLSTFSAYIARLRGYYG